MRSSISTRADDPDGSWPAGGHADHAPNVRIRYTLSPSSAVKRSLTVLPGALEIAGPVLGRRGRPLRLSTEACVEIDRNGWPSPTGRPTAAAHARTRSGGKTLDPIDVHVSVFDEADVVVSEAATGFG
jgi:hypothetical protein